MRFTAEQRFDDGVLGREFTLGDVPGIPWTPASAPAPAPLILLGHPGGLPGTYPRLVARARHAAAEGFATATIELPGSGDRPRSAATEEARADLLRALGAGGPVDDGIVDRLVLPLVDKSVPEWRAALDALLALPGLGGPVGYAGGVIAIGIRLAVVEPQHLGRPPVRGQRRAPQHGRGGPADHHPAAGPAAVGRRGEPVLRPALEVGPDRRAGSGRQEPTARLPARRGPVPVGREADARTGPGTDRPPARPHPPQSVH